MSSHILEEAGRCLQCKKPRCRTGCPINTNIPEMIRLFKEGQLPDAAEMLFENNPLSMVCSLVCNHEKQCEGHCVRGIRESPVHISEIEHYISDSCFERLRVEKQPDNGIRAAVIGSGPAGITVALKLACLGYRITVFEGNAHIGGILRYGIPEFRLPKTILDRYYQLMLSLGIKFRMNFNIGGAVSIQDLLDDGYGSVFIGTGAWRARRMNIPGETFGNVCYGINYLKDPSVYEVGDTVCIIGAGNSAMDVARTAIRRGVQHVYIYSPSETPAASAEEVTLAKLDGAEFRYGQTAVRILDDGITACDVQMDEEGHILPVEGTEHFVPCSHVIICISQVPKDKLVNRDHELSVSQRGTLVTDDSGATTMEGVFASGDVVTGAKTVVEAVRYSKMIAENMDRYMREKAQA